MKATEREAVVAVVAVRRVDTGDIEVEAERVDCRVGVTRPVGAIAAGVVQLAISNNISATDKEPELSVQGVRSCTMPISIDYIQKAT